MDAVVEIEKLKKNPLWFYVLKNKKSFILGLIFLIITNSLDGLYPLVLKQAIDLISTKATSEQIAFQAFLFFSIMSGLALTRYLWRVYFGRYHTDAAEDVRRKIFNHLTKMGPTFFKKNPVGEILSVLVSDVQSFRNAIGPGVLIFLDGVIILCIILPLMIWLNPTWTWQTLILLPLVPFMIKVVTHRIFVSSKNQQDKLGALSGISQEIVSGIRVIKGFSQEKIRLNYYNQFSLDYEKSCNKTASWESLFVPIMEFGVASGSVILLFIGAPDVLSGATTIGTFVAFQRYITKMVWPMTALGLGFSQYQKGMAAFSRIRDLFNQQTDIPDLGTKKIDEFQELEVKNLSFQYADASQPSLKHLNFKIKAGDFVGIIGPVGSGKTTLLHLLTRLFPSQEKSIFINSIPIEDISQQCLHSLVVMVPQEAFLFSDTISENLNLGLEQASHSQELEKWAQAVDIVDEIKKLPHGFESQLGERGVNLSGGQKQRLTIARALITKSPVVILDDSLSAVDVNTEAKIKSSIENLDNKKTRIIVAHRLSAVEKADQIIVLKDGEIEAIGTHSTLLKSSSTYQSLARIQGYAV